MSTKIEWCDEVWNPVTGCTKVSAGCKNCYAERMAKRLAGRFGYPPAPDQFKVTLHPELLNKPLGWKKPRRVFVNSMSDLFHEDVPFEFIDFVFLIAESTSEHIHSILTKRPDRMRMYFTYVQGTHLGDWNAHFDLAVRGLRKLLDNRSVGLYHKKLRNLSYKSDWPLSNVWLGVSVEDQKTANERLPILVETPAAKRFVSCEPLLGPVDLAEWISPCAGNCDGQKYPIDWVIVGGESGPGARPMEIEWAENIVTQCEVVGIPVFMKQLGGYPDKRNRMEEWPEELRVREWPEE